MSAPLAGLFLTGGTDQARGGSQTFVRGFLTDWDPATGRNLVTIGIVTYSNCLYLQGGDLFESTSVLLGFIDSATKPVILARLGVPT